MPYKNDIPCMDCGLFKSNVMWHGYRYACLDCSKASIEKEKKRRKESGKTSIQEYEEWLANNGH